MEEQNEVKIPEKRLHGYELKSLLAGAACMLVIAAILVGIVWISGGFTGRGVVETVYEGSGFSSPEDAVRAYLKGYKTIHIEEMLSTFAIETFVDNFNFEAQVRSNLVYSTLLKSNLAYPNKCKLLTRDNIYQRLFQIEKDIADQVIGYAEPDFSAVNMDAMEYMEAQELVDAIIDIFPDDSDFDGLSSLTILRFLAAEEMGISSSYGKPAVKEYIDAAIEMYGIDDLRDVAVICNIGGRNYYLTFTAFQYGNKWFLGEIGGTTGMSLPDGEEIIKGLYMAPINT